MITRYTIHYWFHDEHDQLQLDRESLKGAVNTIRDVLGCHYKDYLIVAGHYERINEPFDYRGKLYDDWKWRLVDDDFIEYYDQYGTKQLND